MAFKLNSGLGLSWNLVFQRGNRLPIEDSVINHSYAHLLWELNQDNSVVPNTSQANKGGSGNFYVGHITTIPYAWGENGAYTQAKYPENTLDTKGPWYITYCDTDENPNPSASSKGKYAFPAHGKNGNGNTYYADRIVLRQELDYALDKNYVNKYQLGTYYTGVGMWWDSWNTINGGSRKYVEANEEVPNDTYFDTGTYSEIFNDYAYNRATGSYAHAEGYHSYVVSSDNAHAEGKATIITSSENAHAEGLSTVIDNAHEAHVEGNSTKAFNGAHASHTEGTGSYTKGANAHAENSAYANGLNSHAGGEATAGGDWSFAHGKKGTLSAGAYSVAFNNSFTYGDYSFSEGSQNTTHGSYSHAEGENNTINTAYSHSEGKSNYINGEGSHTEGCYNYVSGLHSHVEGHHNASYADDTHIEGRENKIETLGHFSHAEGSYNTVRSFNSHSEGTYNIVNGISGHAEGFTNNVNSNYAHTEGANNVTNGIASHTEGFHNYTYKDYEHAQGKWNHAYSTVNGGSLHTIGDGANADARHNVVTIFNNGAVNVDSKDNVYVNAANDISTYSKTLHLTSPSAIFTLDSVEANSDKLHYHVTNEACIKGKYTYFKGSDVTYIGKDAEENVTGTTYITGKTKLEYIDGTSEETTKGTKTIINNGGLSIANNNGNDVTIRTTGPVSIKTTGSVTKNTTGPVKDTIHGSLTEHVTMSRTTDIDGQDTQRHNAGLTDITTGTSYYYTDGIKTDAVTGNYNIRVDGTSGKSIGVDDNLDVEGNKTTVVKKNYRLSATSAYIESLHTYIGPMSTNNVPGWYSISIGDYNTVSGSHATAIGTNNYIEDRAANSINIGRYLETYNYGEIALGIYNKSYYRSVFEVGVGTSEYSRQNAFTVYNTGVTYFHFQPYAYDSYVNSVTYGSWDMNKQAYTLYSPTDYPDQSLLVSDSYFRMSYNALFTTTKTVVDNIASVDSVQSLDSIERSYTDNVLHYTTGHYDQTQEKYILAKHQIAQESATKELAGLMSGEDKVRSDDLEDRLNATVKSANLPTFALNTIIWKVYNNDKSKVLATYITEENSDTNHRYTSISAEYGTYVTAENYTIKMNLNSNYDAAFLNSVTTKGSFTMPDKSDFNPIKNGSAVMSGNLSLTYTYISTSNSANPNFKKYVAPASQTVSAIKQFGLQYLTTRTLANGHTQVYRINDPDTYDYDKNSFNVSVSGSFGIIKWYGVTSTNPATLSASMSQANFEKLFTGAHTSNNSNAKGLAGYAAKTDTTNKYFMYVYRKALGVLSKAEVPGADATAWFNTKNPKTITITRTTTGMKEDYYIVYSLNENALNGALLTFS